MNKTLGWTVAVALTGLTLHCSSTPSMATADLAVAMQDLSVAQAADFSVAHDLTPAADLTPAVYNNCPTASFMDQSAAGASRAVTFPNGNLTYSPKCILISANQSVTFNGAFASHPLRPGVGATATVGSPNNPIPANTNTGTTLTVPFPTAGDYPYNCAVHDGVGMNGVVRVK